MRLPKKVIIAAREWDITENKKDGGGKFFGSEYKIEIGTKYKKDIPGVFLHEVAEAILAEKCLRFNNGHSPATNGDYLFVMNHEQFEQFIFDLAYALKDYLK